MSISAIAANQPPLDPSTAASGGLASSLQLLANNYNALGQSLASGDLSGAQQAYASLIQTATGAGGSDATTGATPSPTSIASSTGSSSGSSSGGSVGADLAALGRALESGNLAGAQQAFATLNQAIQSVGAAGHGHGAHGGGKDASGGDASSGSSSATASTVTNQVTTTNADGSLSVTTTYADGTSTTKIEPNPRPTQSTNTLDPSNPGQLLALLGAQEQSRSR